MQSKIKYENEKTEEQNATPYASKFLIFSFPKATEIRTHPTYMLYYTVSTIFHPTLTTGIIPIAALAYMNTKIFLGKLPRQS